MLEPQNEFSRDCYERAARARANASAVTDRVRKAEFLAMEERWLRLAKSGSVAARLNRFIASEKSPHPQNSGVAANDFWPVDFERGEKLISQGGTVSTVFFVTDAVISLRAPAGLEIAMLGPDAGIGMLSALNGGDYPYEAVTRISGAGLACSAASFRDLVFANNTLLRKVLAAEQKIIDLIAETAVSVAVNPLATRLAKWFVRLHDLSGRIYFDATQDELSICFGVTRPSVTTAQDQLRSEGLIDYSRGRIQIIEIDRLRLRANATD